MVWLLCQFGMTVRYDSYVLPNGSFPVLKFDFYVKFNVFYFYLLFTLELYTRFRLLCPPLVLICSLSLISFMVISFVMICGVLWLSFGFNCVWVQVIWYPVPFRYWVSFISLFTYTTSISLAATSISYHILLSLCYICVFIGNTVPCGILFTGLFAIFSRLFFKATWPTIFIFECFTVNL